MFEAMGARLELAQTCVEEARLWSLLEAFDGAAACLEEARRLCLECGAPARAGELDRLERELLP
jgi:hypothetical protein